MSLLLGQVKSVDRGSHSDFTLDRTLSDWSAIMKALCAIKSRYRSGDCLFGCCPYLLQVSNILVHLRRSHQKGILKPKAKKEGDSQRADLSIRERGLTTAKEFWLGSSPVRSPFEIERICKCNWHRVLSGICINWYASGIFVLAEPSARFGFGVFLHRYPKSDSINTGRCWKAKFLFS